MINAIIFDFFDVIRSDPYKAWLKNHGYKREGEFLEIVDKMDAGKIEMGEFLNGLSELSGQSIEDLIQEFEAVSKVNFDIIELIKNLKENYRIGLLSNAPSEYIRDILRKNDLEKCFDEIVVSSEVGHIKPSKEIFDIMLSRLQIAASEVLFIDDSKLHIDGAEKIGVKGIVFENEHQLKEELTALDIKI